MYYSTSEVCFYAAWIPYIICLKQAGETIVCTKMMENNSACSFEELRRKTIWSNCFDNVLIHLYKKWLMFGLQKIMCFTKTKLRYFFLNPTFGVIKLYFTTPLNLDFISWCMLVSVITCIENLICHVQKEIFKTCYDFQNKPNSNKITLVYLFVHSTIQCTYRASRNSDQHVVPSVTKIMFALHVKLLCLFTKTYTS